MRCEGELDGSGAGSGVSLDELSTAWILSVVTLGLPLAAIGLLRWRRHHHPLAGGPRNWRLLALCSLGPIICLPGTSFGLLVDVGGSTLPPDLLCNLHFYAIAVGYFASPLAIMLSFLQVRSVDMRTSQRCSRYRESEMRRWGR